MRITHIVWDWNGTLFDDLSVVLAASNQALGMLGVPPLAVDEYRSTFRRPLTAFHEAILGRAPTPNEATALDEEFHDHYRRNRSTVTLAPMAREALSTAAAHGIRQSLLSMWHHDELVELVADLGLTSMFHRVDGRRPGTGTTKREALRAHLQAQRTEPHEVVVVGDAIDDALAGLDLGCQVLLVSEGSCHHEADLSRHAPVVSSVKEAARTVIGLSPRARGSSTTTDSEVAPPPPSGYRAGG
jgi:phosphoglycolate phosphatase-like HAD superfamily hydrolase